LNSPTSPKQYDEQNIRDQFQRIIQGVCNQVVTSGDICLEAGALLGVDSLNLATLVNPSGRVYIFECIDENEIRLLQHMENYSLHDIVTVNPLTLPKKSTLHNVAKLGEITFKDSTSAPEKLSHMINFDTFASENELKRLDLIKLSLGGDEFDALKSAYGSIKKFRPLLLFNTPTEVHGQLFNYDFCDLLTFKDKTEYAFFDLLGDSYSDKHWRTSLPWFFTVGIPQELLTSNGKFVDSIHSISNKRKNNSKKLFQHLSYIVNPSPVIKLQQKGHDKVSEFTMEEFARETNFLYQAHLTFENDDFCQSVIMQCKEAINNDTMEEETLWQSLIDSQALREHQLVDSTIKIVSEEGAFGLFTNVDIPEEAFIGEYTGVISSANENSDFFKEYPLENLDNDEKLIINAQNCGNEMRFIQKSHKGNVLAMEIFHDGILHIVYKAIKNISAGEQLLSL
jgi:uncharacterized protein